MTISIVAMAVLVAAIVTAAVAMAVLVAAIVTAAEVGFIYFIYLITRRALK